VRIAQLELKVKQLEHDNKTLEKNSKQHCMDMIEVDLSMDNIEGISCIDESKLDDSVILGFRELVTLNTEAETAQELKRNMVGELHKMSNGDK
jgi:hypothetical protein